MSFQAGILRASSRAGVTVNPLFLDHFKNPRNVGDLEDAHGRAEAENPVCGDQIVVALRLEGGRVSAIAHRVRGCSGAIAAASIMSELACQAAPEALGAIDRDAIDGALGGLPTLKRHGADLAAEGLQAALAAAHTGES